MVLSTPVQVDSWRDLDGTRTIVHNQTSGMHSQDTVQYPTPPSLLATLFSQGQDMEESNSLTTLKIRSAGVIMFVLIVSDAAINHQAHK
jgi:hypothetical protein